MKTNLNWLRKSFASTLEGIKGYGFLRLSSLSRTERSTAVPRNSVLKITFGIQVCRACVSSTMLKESRCTQISVSQILVNVQIKKDPRLNGAVKW